MAVPATAFEAAYARIAPDLRATTSDPAHRRVRNKRIISEGLKAAEPAIRADERELCAQMAEQDAAHADLMVASDEARIVGEVLRNFADRLRGDRS